jgi:hypothetical protein
LINILINKIHFLKTLENEPVPGPPKRFPLDPPPELPNKFPHGVEFYC